MAAFSLTHSKITFIYFKNKNFPTVIFMPTRTRLLRVNNRNLIWSRKEDSPKNCWFALFNNRPHVMFGVPMWRLSLSQNIFIFLSIIVELNFFLNIHRAILYMGLPWRNYYNPALWLNLIVSICSVFFPRYNLQSASKTDSDLNHKLRFSSIINRK